MIMFPNAYEEYMECGYRHQPAYRSQLQERFLSEHFLPELCQYVLRHAPWLAQELPLTQAQAHEKARAHNGQLQTNMFVLLESGIIGDVLMAIRQQLATNHTSLMRDFQFVIVGHGLKNVAGLPTHAFTSGVIDGLLDYIDCPVEWSKFPQDQIFIDIGFEFLPFNTKCPSVGLIDRVGFLHFHDVKSRSEGPMALIDMLHKRASIAPASGLTRFHTMLSQSFCNFEYTFDGHSSRRMHTISYTPERPYRGVKGITSVRAYQKVKNPFFKRGSPGDVMIKDFKPHRILESVDILTNKVVSTIQCIRDSCSTHLIHG